MITFRELLASTLRKNRPKLSPSSVKTCTSILLNLHKNLNGSNENVEWFRSNSPPILQHLENKNKSTEKSTLSALYVLTQTKRIGHDFEKMVENESKPICIDQFQ